MEILCINSIFPYDYLQWAKENNVKLPQECTIYTIRDVILHDNKKKGLLLEEIVNPKVDTKHSILGDIKIEPTFSIERFANLQGNEITSEEVKEFLKQKKHDHSKI